MRNRIKSISILFSFGLMLILFGITYSFFYYSSFSNESIINCGEVFMKMTRNSNNITLNNVFPESYKQALYQNGIDGTLRTDNIIEFNISGKKASGDPIYYEIDLEYGEDIQNKVRISDKFLKFELLDITDSNNIEEIFSNVNYETVNNKKIYVESINNSNYSKTFRLRMWIDETMLVSDSLPDADYKASNADIVEPNRSLTLYTDLFSSIQVKVIGDLIEKVNPYADMDSTCFTYSNNGTGITINGYNNSCGTDVIIPKQIDNLPVTQIGNNAFRNNSTITSVKIGNNVTRLGDYAFQNCTSLTNISIPNSVTHIGQYSFVSTRLTSVIIPDSVTHLGGYAFYGCAELKSIELSNNLIELSGGTFRDCTNLVSITLPDSIIRLNNQDFYNCSKLEYVKLPSNLQELSGFEKCIELTDIYIPNTVTTIGSAAFYNCSKLRSVNIPNGVTELEYHTFYKCTSLRNITIPDSVTSIQGNVFEECTSLLSITIPGSVTTIGSGVFERCKSLKNLVISNGVTTIGSSAFADCSSLISVTIPNSVTTIEQYAFQLCKNLKSITLSNNLTILEDYVFELCPSLTNVVIPNGITTIKDAFSGCSSLTNLVIPNSVTSIDFNIFPYNRNLKDVYVSWTGSNVSNVLVVNEDDYYDEEDYEFDPNKINLHIPSGTLNLYSSHENFKKFHLIEDN